MESAIYHLLSYLNLADADLIAGLPNESGQAIGPKVASIVVAERAKYKGGFSSIEQLYPIPGIGETGAKVLIGLFTAKPKHPGFVKSNSQFTFANGAPKLAEFEGKVIFERVEMGQYDENLQPVKTGNQALYDMYYAEGLEKGQVLKAIETSLSWVNTSATTVFAIQMRNNEFVATSVPNWSVYSRSIYFANKFRVHSQIVNPHPPYSFPFYQTNKPNPYLAVSLAMEWYTRNGLLSFDETANRVRVLDLATTTNLTAAEYFDIQGIIGKPSWASQGHFKSFNMLNFKQSNITSSDPREYIAANPALGSQTALVGSNDQVGWTRDKQFRYVQIVENVSIQSVHNSSHNGSQRVYLNVNNYNGDMSALYVNFGAAIPDSAKFDMYVFYGKWAERGNIACRVAFKSKLNGRFVCLDNSLEDVNSTSSDLNERSSFYVEQGWGTDVNNVALKTFYGKYLFVWQTAVGAETVVPIDAEQFRIYIP